MSRRVLKNFLIAVAVLSGSAGADISEWTPRQARGACASLAAIAVRRASTVKLVFTRPATYRQGTWKLQGFALLTGAPNGLRRAPFYCTFTKGTDNFYIEPGSLTMGP
ncbi:hypothetical protein DAETH_12980 [Deinococcus aetherius]|uniref:Uncharacterized protein n=1 Tax=Deinococcus aetherius TaxID=200252 RepID=A0ABN6REM2_9DEIO|nr:hypothetical protein DAETH_12980 [Deinococcus aetherius]